MSLAKTFLAGLLVLLSFLAVALVQAWPLPLHLATHVTGIPDGDTGVYIWNTWVFGHELLGPQGNPFLTDRVLALGPSVDLSLHNYTVFADLLTLPLQRPLGIVAAFNLVYLLNFALAGCGMYLLARRALRATSSWVPEAWLAGLLFACSPFLVARSTAHFSLAAAASLPFFAWCFDRVIEERRIRDALAAGGCIAWAAYSDPYYAIYCVMLGVSLIVARVANLTFERDKGTRRPWIPWTDVPMAVLIALVLVVHVGAGGSLDLGALSLSMHTLYTPILALTTLLVTRLLLMFRPRLSWSVPPVGPYVAPALVMVAAAALLLAPQLVSLGARAIEGDMVKVPVLWRSSAPGVDLVSLLLPNPAHPLAPGFLAEWTASQPNRYEENVASIPWVVLITIGAAYCLAGISRARAWAAIGLFFASLSLGPFIRIAGVNSYVPTPWTFLRYVPVVGDARMPTRFSVIVIMAVAVVLALALNTLLRRFPSRRRAAMGLFAIVLGMELLPAPRHLYGASIPAPYQSIAADDRQLTLMELPFGVRDGLSSLGHFTAASLYYQTAHRKRILGGYLSRVSDSTKNDYLNDAVLSAILKGSEGAALSDMEYRSAVAAGAEFVARTQLGWVVMEHGRVPSQLRAFAIEALQLTLRESDGRFELYEPAAMPPAGLATTVE
jgi:hypothetical protein